MVKFDIMLPWKYQQNEKHYVQNLQESASNASI